MPVEVSWYVPDRIIMARFWGHISVEESAQVTPQILRLMDASPAPHIHVFKVKYKRFDTVAEACAFLGQLEPDLKDLFPQGG